jgi:alpha-tubulin suppressor-like RCC1 family protein
MSSTMVVVSNANFNIILDSAVTVTRVSTLPTLTPSSYLRIDCNKERLFPSGINYSAAFSASGVLLTLSGAAHTASVDATYLAQQAAQSCYWKTGNPRPAGRVIDLQFAFRSGQRRALLDMEGQSSYLSWLGGGGNVGSFGDFVALSLAQAFLLPTPTNGVNPSTLLDASGFASLSSSLNGSLTSAIRTVLNTAAGQNAMLHEVLASNGPVATPTVVPGQTTANNLPTTAFAGNLFLNFVISQVPVAVTRHGATQTLTLQNLPFCIFAYSDMAPYAFQAPLFKGFSNQDRCFAYDASGNLWGWGNNSVGGLGIGASGATPVLSPSVVSAFGSLRGRVVREISIGDHSIACDSTGGVHVWGSGAYGQIGNGTTAGSLVPVLASDYGTLSTATVVSVSSTLQSCIALDASGRVHSWGSIGMTEWVAMFGSVALWSISLQPVYLPGLPSNLRFVQIEGGFSHAMALDSSGSVYCWGTALNGRLGNNNHVLDVYAPLCSSLYGSLVNSRVAKISCGMDYCMALDVSGNLHFWGRMTLVPTAFSRPAIAGRTITDLSSSDYTLFLDSEGYVYSFGYDKSYGKLGTPVASGIGNWNSATTPVVGPIGPLAVAGSRVLGIRAARNTGFAVDTSGNVYAWGANNEGQFGLGTSDTNTNLVPRLVGRFAGPSGYTAPGTLPAPVLAEGLVRARNQTLAGVSFVAWDAMTAFPSGLGAFTGPFQISSTASGATQIQHTSSGVTIVQVAFDVISTTPVLTPFPWRVWVVDGNADEYTLAYSGTGTRSLLFPVRGTGASFRIDQATAGTYTWATTTTLHVWYKVLY